VLCPTFVFLFIFLFICLFVHSLIYLFIYLFIPFIYLFIHSFIYSSIHLFIYFLLFPPFPLLIPTQIDVHAEANPTAAILAKKKFESSQGVEKEEARKKVLEAYGAEKYR